jgi:hypothetical protein
MGKLAEKVRLASHFGRLSGGKTMVAVKLIGGLGNQMFQYATGFRLARALRTDLVLNTTAFEQHYKLHRYGLHHFSIQATIADQRLARELAAFESPDVGRRRSPWYARILGARRKRIECYHESGFAMDEKVLGLSGDVYLIGYWQSEKYFADVADELVRQFAVHSAPTGENADLARMIDSTNSVAVHIRRGDYVSNATTNQVHGTCTPQYYARCMDAIERHEPDCVFFVFSDDPAWCAEHFSGRQRVRIVSHNGSDRNVEDLRLMSRCKHNIIANSSFSWWGAWLNRNPAKRVFAPRRWFQVEDRDTRDLLPKSWRLE